jgi:hypothetical protein
MRHPTAIAAALAAACVLLPRAADAQVPWSTEGRLGPQAPRDDAERPYMEHQVQLDARQRLRISATSEDFDTIIQIYRAGSDEILAEDDDGGEGLNSRLTFTPAARGSYTLRVLGFGEDSSGAYEARIDALPPLPPVISAAASATETTTWQVHSGVLSDRDGDTDGSFFHDYRLSLRAGEEVIIRADSDDFDTILQVRPLDDREGDWIAFDDDGGGGLNSLLVFGSEEGGDYAVRVTTFEAGTTGSYRLRIGR